jgi:hypothetical protein
VTQSAKLDQPASGSFAHILMHNFPQKKLSFSRKI